MTGLPTEGSRLLDAARKGDTDILTALLDEYPDMIHVRDEPYEWSLLHAAAHGGHLAAVDLLLRRGLDPDTREKGDNTYALHWAAAAGHLDVVRRLVDAGGDVIGDGDDHALQVIGWATAWDGCDDATHRAIADILVSHGARHHIFSAMSLGDTDEVRRVVEADPSQLARPLSRNEDFQLPLHFAVRKNLPDMVRLLLELGADPQAKDASGYTAAAYATNPDVDRPVMEMLRDRGEVDLLTALSLGDLESAERLLRASPGSAEAGVLHLTSKRNDIAAVKWLLERSAKPDTLWSHWTAEVTPLHLAALHGHAAVVRALLDAGADPHIHDSEHDSDPLGWAEYAGRIEIVSMLSERPQ